MVQEYKQQSKDDFQLPAFDSINENKVEICIRKSFLPLPDNASYLQYWSDYAVKLNRVLCSFLLASEENRSHHVLLSTGRSAMPVSSVYGELSIKWIMRVLLTIFPCIKAFTNQNEVPIHLRWIVPSVCKIFFLNISVKYLRYNWSTFWYKYLSVPLVFWLACFSEPFSLMLLFFCFFLPFSAGSLSIPCRILFFMHSGRFLFPHHYCLRYFEKREYGTSSSLRIFSILDQRQKDLLSSVAHIMRDLWVILKYMPLITLTVKGRLLELKSFKWK